MAEMKDLAPTNTTHLVTANVGRIDDLYIAQKLLPFLSQSRDACCDADPRFKPDRDRLPRLAHHLGVTWRLSRTSKERDKGNAEASRRRGWIRG